MKFRSFRRFYLDQCLDNYKHIMKGRVLDIGGRKIGKRGTFRPPVEDVTSWEYVNTDLSTKPDYCCDAKAISLPDETADTVIMTELLEYLPEPTKVLSEIHRLLKKGGHVLISTPFLNPIHGDYWVDRTRYTSIKLREITEEAGFQVATIEKMGSVGAVIYDVLKVACGYAASDNNYSRWNRLLERCRGFFSWLDKKTVKQKKYINTGYFLVMRKL